MTCLIATVIIVDQHSYIAGDLFNNKRTRSERTTFKTLMQVNLLCNTLVVCFNGRFVVS